MPHGQRRYFHPDLAVDNIFIIPLFSVVETHKHCVRKFVCTKSPPAEFPAAFQSLFVGWHNIRVLKNLLDVVVVFTKLLLISLTRHAKAAFIKVDLNCHASTG